MAKGFRSKILNDFQRRGIYEVGRWSAHLPDELISADILTDRQQIHYANLQGGVWLITHAGVKSMLIDLRNLGNDRQNLLKFGLKKLQHNQNPSYSTIEPVETHLLDQTDYDQSCQEDPSCSP